MGIRQPFGCYLVETLAVATVIFDADDTLWDTQRLYEISKAQFFLLMRESGFPRQEVAATLETIDYANVSKLGFSRKRFPQSMYETYGALCAKRARPFNKTIARQTIEIGSAVFKAAPQIFDGVHETLSALRLNNVKLVLATKGDKEVQGLRLNISCLRPYFDSVHILEEKGVSEFTRLISDEHVTLSHGWSVGNSAPSDINPALTVGLRAIWIPRETWIYEAGPAVSNERLHIVSSITEVPSIVLREL
jgi:putative hydrolase of the HAD superfamily